MIGETLGSYRVLRQIGTGGMGVVYLAQHAIIGRPAAIKVLLPQFTRDSEFVNRFFNEARTVGQIRHPGLVDVFDFGYHASGAAYLVMEYLQGETVSMRLMREGRIAPWLMSTIVRQVASAVGAAHAKGIIHRDLKPENLFLVPERGALGNLRVKVLDFGVAKLSGAAAVGAMSNLTRTGSMLGTPHYMSPEQARGAGQLDHRSDIYSLGCMIFEMLTGRKPFDGRGLGEILAAQQRLPAPSMTLFDPTLGGELDALVQRLLAKRPDDRPKRMEDVEIVLEQLAQSRGWDMMWSRTGGSPPILDVTTMAIGSPGAPPLLAMPGAPPMAPRPGVPVPMPISMQSGPPIPAVPPVPVPAGRPVVPAPSTLSGSAREVPGAPPAPAKRGKGLVLIFSAAVAFGGILAASVSGGPTGGSGSGSGQTQAGVQVGTSAPPPGGRTAQPSVTPASAPSAPSGAASPTGATGTSASAPAVGTPPATGAAVPAPAAPAAPASGSAPGAGPGATTPPAPAPSGAATPPAGPGAAGAPGAAAPATTPTPASPPSGTTPGAAATPATGAKAASTPTAPAAPTAAAASPAAPSAAGAAASPAAPSAAAASPAAPSAAGTAAAGTTVKPATPGAAAATPGAATTTKTPAATTPASVPAGAPAAKPAAGPTATPAGGQAATPAGGPAVTPAGGQAATPGAGKSPSTGTATPSAQPDKPAATGSAQAKAAPQGTATTSRAKAKRPPPKPDKSEKPKKIEL